MKNETVTIQEANKETEDPDEVWRDILYLVRDHTYCDGSMDYDEYVKYGKENFIVQKITKQD